MTTYTYNDGQPNCNHSDSILVLPLQIRQVYWDKRGAHCFYDLEYCPYCMGFIWTSGGYAEFAADQNRAEQEVVKVAGLLLYGKEWDGT